MNAEPARADADRSILTTGEVAEILQVSDKTIRRLVRERKIRKLAGVRNVRITRAALDEYMRGDVEDAS